jgi:hypothetical protein
MAASAQEAEWLTITGKVVRCKEGDTRFYYVTDGTGAEWVANAKHPGPRENEALFKEAYNTAQLLKMEVRSFPNKPGSIWKIRGIELMPAPVVPVSVPANVNIPAAGSRLPAQKVSLPPQLPTNVNVKSGAVQKPL